MNETTGGKDSERMPSRLDVVPLPEKFWQIFGRITRVHRRPELRQQRRARADVVDGFEDIVSEPLGAGMLENNPRTTYGLVGALAVCGHPMVDTFLNDGKMRPSEIMHELREARVLKGMKVLSMERGLSYFALAAQALGAQAYTAGEETMSKSARRDAPEHFVVDPGASAAPQKLLRATGGDFDLIFENLPADDSAEHPKTAPEPIRISLIAEQLLKSGGFLFYSHGFNRSGAALKKR